MEKKTEKEEKKGKIVRHINQKVLVLVSLKYVVKNAVEVMFIGMMA